MNVQAYLLASLIITFIVLIYLFINSGVHLSRIARRNIYPGKSDIKTTYSLDIIAAVALLGSVSLGLVSYYKISDVVEKINKPETPAEEAKRMFEEFFKNKPVAFI